jgi:hypothetical protein
LPAERESINRVAGLGSHVRRLRSFVDRYRYIGTFADIDEVDADVVYYASGHPRRRVSPTSHSAACEDSVTPCPKA